MKTRLIVAAVALVLGSGAVYAVSASGMGDCDSNSGWGKGAKQGGMHGGMQGKMHAKGQMDTEQMQQRMLDRLEKKLSLTEQQRQQIGEVMGQGSAQMPAKHAQMQEFRTQMQGLDPAAADYQDQVAVLAKQKAELMSQQMVERAKQHAQIFALLTPEQQQEFRQLQEQRGDHEGGHHRP